MEGCSWNEWRVALPPHIRPVVGASLRGREARQKNEPLLSAPICAPSDVDSDKGVDEYS